METTTENILDVTQLAPPVKHSTIFARIAELKDGESLILHNDHDPAPLRHQLGHTHQDTIGWEYLEKGPQSWKVKLTKQQPRNNEAGRNILDVTKLPPEIKHSTIFGRLDALQSGESLTIHNDHDPAPLQISHLDSIRTHMKRTAIFRVLEQIARPSIMPSVAKRLADATGEFASHKHAHGYRKRKAEPEGPAKARATRRETRAQEEIMTAASSAGRRTRWRLLRLRMRARAAAGGWCSCGHLPTEHAQRVRLDFFFVLDYRQPIGIFVHRSVALRTLPDDLQSPVLYFEATAQISSGNANIAVRDIAFRAGRACGASSNGSAKTVPVWLSCVLHAGCATEGGAHAATCSLELQRS